MVSSKVVCLRCFCCVLLPHPLPILFFLVSPITYAFTTNNLLHILHLPETCFWAKHMKLLLSVVPLQVRAALNRATAAIAKGFEGMGPNWTIIPLVFG